MTSLINNQCYTRNHRLFKNLFSKHEFTLDMEPGDIILKGDKHRLEQVIINVVNNAIKYSPDANKVAVIVKKFKGYIQVGVKDHGIGIAKEELKKLFDRFYRASAPLGIAGLGIGLYIS